MKYKKKPVVIEAVKWNGDKISEVTDWISKALDKGVIMRFGNEVSIQQCVSFHFDLTPPQSKPYSFFS